MRKRKLIEAALPLDAINAASRADKDRKTGTIRNIHKWFAPMPTPAWRALLFASVVDDPGTAEEREALWSLIEELVASGPEPPAESVLARAKNAIRTSVGHDVPLVLDPFCGGGSTLVEALRLGLPARGSDLNPVPTLISRALVTLLPTVSGQGPFSESHGQVAMSGDGRAGFVTDVLAYAEGVRESAQRALAANYPQSPAGNTVYAWLWARTALCSNPACGKRTVLATSWWLSKRKGERAWLLPATTRDSDEVEFRIETAGDGPVPPPKTGRGATFSCLHCAASIGEEHLAREGEHGRLAVRLLALACIDGEKKRTFELPDETQTLAAYGVQEDPALRDLNVSDGGGRQRFGCDTYADIFLPRQALALDTFARAVDGVRDRVIGDGADGNYADTVATFLGLCVGRLAHANSSQCRWNVAATGFIPKIEPAFGRHDLPMSWDFAESNPFAGSVGDWNQVVKTALRAVRLAPLTGSAATGLADARRAIPESERGQVLVATDPPYFGHIDYSELSDYFYIWLRRALRRVHPDLFSVLVPPRRDELVALPSRHDGSSAGAYNYFVSGFTEVFRNLCQGQDERFPMLIVYAHREGERGTAGWEAMLEAVLAAGLMVVGTLPLHATRNQRMTGLGTNALATYVVMVCRPRPDDAARITRQDLVRLLRAELVDAVSEFQAASIAPVDLAQAVIGPGMQIYSRHGAVLETDGSRVNVGAALSVINRTLAEIIDEQEADLDAPSRWAVTWYEQHGLESASFGEADQLARAKGTSADELVRAGIVDSGGNKVALIPRDEMPDEWSPATDAIPTAWEAVQHLVVALSVGGEQQAAATYRTLGQLADPARELAYRLFRVAEGAGLSDEALAYNGLVTSWSEIARLAASIPDAPTGVNAPEGLF
jgi:putative DNA methylase